MLINLLRSDHLPFADFSLRVQSFFTSVTSRLQSNLSYLASVADQFNSKRKPGSSLPRLDPFPSTSLPADSPLIGLYTSLAETFKSEVALQSESKSTTTSDGKKREREESEMGEESRKKPSLDESQKVSTTDSPSNSTSTTNPVTSNIVNDSIQNASSPLNNLLASAPTPPNPGTPILVNNVASNPASLPPPPQQQQQQPGNSLSAQNAQSLVNAYGPSAIGYLQALQSHARGIPHPFITYMEANVPGFKGAPVQSQLQQMLVSVIESLAVL